MRNFAIALLLACGIYQGWERDPAEYAEVGEDGVAPVAAPPPGPLERIGRLVGNEPEPEPELASVPVVHCVIDEVGAFLRRTECLERGGAIDEPSWARSEG